MAEQQFDVVIAGAGMLGAAAAFHLTKLGARVAVIEAGEPAAGATGNSFAWLNAVGKTPEAYHRLNAAGMADHHVLRAPSGRASTEGRGCLEWALAGASRAALWDKVRRLESWGYSARIISLHEARSREPELAFPEDALIVLYERDRWVDAPGVARTLLEQVQAAGGVIQTGARVEGFGADGDRVTSVETSAGTFQCRHVLLSAGTGTPALAAKLGAHIPVNRSPGLLAVTTPIGPLPLSHVVYAPGIHLRPDVSGGLRLGADDIDALTTEETPAGPPPGWAAPLLERAAAVLPAARGARLSHVHIGVRPVPADGLTVAGRLPGKANAYVVVTHSGITLGPLLGRLMAEEITGHPPDPLLADFRPDRFLHAPATEAHQPLH